MSDQAAPGPQQGAGGEQPEMTAEQEQMLRQMEEEMRRVRVQDLLTQSVVSILNLTHRRIAKEDERDLEQARVGIEAIRATADLLEPEAQTEIKNALAQIQVLYAQAAGESGGGAEPGGGGGFPPEGGGRTQGGPGPGSGEQGGERKPPPGLWVPGSG